MENLTPGDLLNFGIFAVLLIVIMWQRADMRRMQDTNEKLGNRLADMLDRAHESVVALYLPPPNIKP